MSEWQSPLTKIEIFENHVVKTSLGLDPLKRNSIEEEIRIISELNDWNCPCVPQLIESGTDHEGNPFFAVQRVKPVSLAPIADLWLSYLAVRGCGWEHGDLMRRHTLYDGRIVFLIDYDQAFPVEARKTWQNGNISPRLRKSFSAISAKPLNLATTSMAKQGCTTIGSSGMYHSISEKLVLMPGERGLGGRRDALSAIKFAGEHVLDLGCNTGELTRYLIREGGAATAIGVEHSESHALLGQTVNCVLSLRNAKIVRGKIGSDPLPGDRFNTALIFSVFHHLAQPEEAGREIAAKVDRIIVEAGLVEHGCSNGGAGQKWVKTGGWRLDNWDDLNRHLVAFFPGFQFNRDYGCVDRGRKILEFVRG